MEKTSTIRNANGSLIFYKLYVKYCSDGDLKAQNCKTGITTHLLIEVHFVRTSLQEFPYNYGGVDLSRFAPANCSWFLHSHSVHVSNFCFGKSLEKSHLNDDMFIRII